MGSLTDNIWFRRVVIIAVVVGVVWGGSWLLKQQESSEEEVSPEIVLEPAKMMGGDENLVMPMSEAEKQAIDQVFTNEGAEMTILKDVSGGQAIGTAWRHFDESKFTHKVKVSKLTDLEKGFFYEGWLVGETGFFSTGRMGAVDGEGTLYYTSDEDKSAYRGVVVTLEPEDGDPAPADHVVEGSF